MTLIANEIILIQLLAGPLSMPKHGNNLFIEFAIITWGSLDYEQLNSREEKSQTESCKVKMPFIS